MLRKSGEWSEKAVSDPDTAFKNSPDHEICIQSHLRDTKYQNIYLDNHDLFLQKSYIGLQNMLNVGLPNRLFQLEKHIQCSEVPLH